MSKHRSIYGPYAGRFLSLEKCPLWRESDYEDGEPTPDYYGQTRRLAEEAGGSLIDLAGGCVGVVVHEDASGIVCIALSPDDGCETLAIWSEDNEGEQRGESVVVPFRPYEER